MVKTNLNLWTTPAEIKILKDLMDTREASRVTAHLQVAHVQVLKNTFGTFFTDFVKLGFNYAASFKVAQDIVWEG
eukprot:663360-Rhodomonas_salina.1